MIKPFLDAILGTSGAQALLKAVERNPSLETVLVPRTLVAWLNLAVRESFEGAVPGAPNSYVRLTKSESGYTGAVTVGDFVHTFDANTVLHVAAALSVSMGVRDAINDVGPEQLQRLGKSLDLLVRAKALSEVLGDDLQKATVWEHLARQKEITAKVELPGQAGQPGEPEPPTGPDPQKKAPAGQGSKKFQPKPAMQKRELKLRGQDLESRCRECGGQQFREQRFQGCLCLRSLAKSVCVRQESNELWLEFGSGLDQDEVQIVIDSVRG